MSLNNFGIDVGLNSLSSSIDAFVQQNLSPSDILAAARSVAQTVDGIVRVSSAIPEMGNISIPKEIGNISSIPGVLRQGASGEWQSSLYGADMNAHHPKFKFLFKVLFVGFGNEEFYRYVHRCDKPRVRINHQDVNYYNFHTRVQTSISYDQISISFLDEIGNSITEFFNSYMNKRTGTSSGHASIHEGFGPSSSTEPYENGYSDGKTIIIEQVFGNGTRSNRYTFINPRIESFDFDELNMEDSNGNMVNVSFSYDAFTTETVSQQTLYSWGATDLLKGGGTSGEMNGHSVNGANPSSQISANGRSVGGIMNLNNYNPAAVLANQSAGIDILNMSKSVLSGIPMSLIPRTAFNQIGIITSAATTLGNDVSNTLSNVFNGNNMRFGGGEPGYVVNSSNSNSIPTFEAPIYDENGVQDGSQFGVQYTNPSEFPFPDNS